jgi:hypothetical protein
VSAESVFSFKKLLLSDCLTEHLSIDTDWLTNSRQQWQVCHLCVCDYLSFLL